MQGRADGARAFVNTARVSWLRTCIVALEAHERNAHGRP